MGERWARRRVGQDRGRRRGSVFSTRITDEQRAALDALRAAGGGPRALGPWLVWRALSGPQPPGTTRAPVVPARALERVPDLARYYRDGKVLPGPGAAAEVLPGRGGRLVLDLCGGSGSWSRPYSEAGYRVELVTLPALDVRTYVPPPDVWGVLAAPPCTEFSLAKNGHDRDLLTGLETVTACLRVIALARPRWWALENPTGLLGRWLGTPRDVWNPCDFGDPWTKRTAVWGDFALPERGPFVEPLSGMPGRTAAERAVTPPGFARAFFVANP